DFSASPLHSVFIDEQRLVVDQDNIKRLVVAQGKIELIQVAQGEIKQQESRLAKMIATGNSIFPKLDTFLQDLRDDRKLNVNYLSHELKGFSAIELPLAETSRLALQQALPQTRISSNEGLDGSRMISDSELWGQIAEDIGNINDNYLGVYEDVVALYTEFYQAFSEILSQMGGWITAGSDGNSVNFDSAALKEALEKLKADFEDKPLFSGTPEEALEWAEELGLPEGCVKVIDGKGYVFIDMTPIDNMIKNLPPPGKIDNAAFQAWQSGFKAQEENLKNTLQTLTQKYSNANSLFDNLVKVLSSTISSCTETCKSFLQG
ncbi:MAG: type III secretion system needle tip protein SctA, partial [Plesiomonas sp.]